jgi:replication-associated recombination protein RarA
MAPSPSSSGPADSRPWVERYRPVNLDQVSHQTEIVATLKDAVETGRLPHLLLYGPPGSGKVGEGVLVAGSQNNDETIIHSHTPLSLSLSLSLFSLIICAFLFRS